MKNEKILEIESLNTEDLDVEDLERRIELAAAVGAEGLWCNCNHLTIGGDDTPAEQ